MDGKEKFSLPPELESNIRLFNLDEPERPRHQPVSDDGNAGRFPPPSDFQASLPIDWSFFASLAIPGESAVFTLHDGKGRFIDATAGSEAIWGLAPEELKKRSLKDFISERDALNEWIFTLEQSDSPKQFTIQTNESPGRPANFKRIPLFVSQDPLQSRIVLKVVPAIAEETAPQPFPISYTLSSIHDTSGRFISANACWSKFLGLDFKTLPGRPLKELIDPDDQPALERFFENLQNPIKDENCIVRIASEDGAIHSLLVSATLDSKSQRIALNARILTLDEQNPAIDLLKVSVELIREGVALLMKVGDSYRICYVNKTFEQLTGYTQSSISGCSLDALSGAQTNAKSILDLEESLARVRSHRSELLLYRRNGDSFWSKTQVYPLRNQQGEANYYAAIFDDATIAKAVTIELEQRNVELNKAVSELKVTQRAIIQQENLRALGQMASGIAHDFNNLLAPILGFSELLLKMPAEKRDEKKLESFLKKIQIAAQDGASVVGRLREFYRSQSEPEEMSIIELPELVGHVREITRHRWKNQSEAKGINIEFQTEIATQRRIKGNESELRQVLTNLIINAVDSIASQGSIKLSLLDHAEKIRIQIKDTGSGMSDEVKLKCVNPFYTTKGKLGTGLGLSIVAGIIQRHGGTFNIESEIGQGTTITMDIPSDEGSVQDPEKLIQEEIEGTLRILLVDDEAVLLEVISELLEAGGHTVDSYADPKQALLAFEKETYDLVITDRAMPCMSGDQLAAEIKALSPDTPIFMITGFGDLIKETGEIPANIDEVLGKPIPLDVLNRKLAELIQKKA